MKVRICDTNGNCVILTDPEANSSIFNKKHIQSIGFTVKGGKIFDQEGNLVGTYRRISFDDLSDRANAVIFGVAALAPAMNESIAGFPYRTYGALIGEVDRRTQICPECVGAPVDEKMPFGIGVRIPAPKKLPGFPSAKPAKKKTPVQGGGGLRARWKDEKV